MNGIKNESFATSKIIIMTMRWGGFGRKELLSLRKPIITTRAKTLDNNKKGID